MTARISPASIQAARAIPVAEAIGAHAGSLKRQGRELVGACPVCGGRDRFAIQTVRNIWNCRGCGLGGDAIDLIRHLDGVSFVDAVASLTADDVERVHEPGPFERMQAAARQRQAEEAEAADRARRTERARAIWAGSVPPADTLAKVYLASRGLALFDGIEMALRFNPRCRWEGGTRPAMVCAYRGIGSGELVGVHRTALDGQGRKLDRKALGISGGAAIMLDEAGPHLVVAEGVETTLTARQFGLGPCWALGSANAIEHLQVIDGVERLTICAEAGEPSRKAVLACGLRWQAAGRTVSVVRPPAGLSDLNDIVRKDRP